jgi:hypothetical protein
MRTLTIGLLSAAALAAGLLLARSQQRQVVRSGQAPSTVQEDETQGVVFLDRLRELGI